MNYKFLYNKIKKFFIIVLLFITIINIKTLAFGPGEYAKKNIAIVGDSYIEFFKHFVSTDDFDYYEFPAEGITKDENVATFINCIENGDNHYILFCAGATDFLQKIDPSIFENYLRLYINLAKEKNKSIFFHTYMSFYRSELRNDGHTVKELDDVYRKLADEFPNVYYIDMSNLDNEDYAFGDGYNYGESFFITLSAKMIYLTESIESVQNTTVFPWFETTNKSKIAVAGDDFASSFVENEKDKFDLIDFSKKDTTIARNSSMFYKAMDSDARDVLISIGIKDYEEKTEVAEFEKTLRSYINLACLRHKYVFLHTYVHFMGERANRTPKVAEYDEVIKKLANEYPNTVFIDMSEFQSAEYQGLNKYYNKKFYDKLFERLDAARKLF